MLNLSTQLFYDAVDLKREGRYGEAIAIYRSEITKMVDATDFTEFTTYARAMAKCYYLQGNPQKALNCYNAIIQLNLLTNGERIKQDAKHNPERIKAWIADWAPEIGYTLAYKAGMYDSSYANAIAGKGGDYSREKYGNEGWNWFVEKLGEYTDGTSFLRMVRSIL